MGAAVSKRKNLRNDAISSVAAKVSEQGSLAPQRCWKQPRPCLGSVRRDCARMPTCSYSSGREMAAAGRARLGYTGACVAARAFGEYLSHTHPENRNGSDHLLSDTFIGQDSDSPDNGRPEPNSLHPPHPASPPPVSEPGVSCPLQAPQSERHLSLVCCSPGEGPQQRGGVYTITGKGGMLGGRGSKESLELEVLKTGREQKQGPLPPPSSTSSSSPPGGGAGAGAGAGPGGHHHGGHHHGNHHHGSHQHVRHHHHHHGHQPSQPLQSSVSAHNIRGWGEADGKEGGSREDCSLGCEACGGGATSQSQRSRWTWKAPRGTQTMA
ncbi:hypothetical protein AAFF_G00027440 [Aldrovandia affinis]|uniref:NMDA receptor synaptonuclear signaling and neuronal migration factor-like n=1 Tax=Aldrovandia affinis TaxID=143900 RepID=A0AAD7WG48_9TELE|nr:hypothetical protein AAFF_G00027440 [Aldrovandia affinis]